MLALNLAVALTSLLTVSAHGRIKTVTSNGVTSHLWEPWQDRFLNPVPATVGERYDTVDPLEVGDFGKSIMTCRQGEQAASLDGSNPVQSQRVQAGSVLKTDWYEFSDNHYGPITVFLAKCPGETCAGVDASSLSWFKIQEDGYSNGKWAFQRWYFDQGMNWETTIPADIESGAYLYRWELVALHELNTPQWYPRCIDLIVEGGGSSKPTNTVKFPDLITRDSAAAYFELNPWAASEDEKMAFNAKILGGPVYQAGAVTAPEPAPSSVVPSAVASEAASVSSAVPSVVPSAVVSDAAPVSSTALSIAPSAGPSNAALVSSVPGASSSASSASLSVSASASASASPAPSAVAGVNVDASASLPPVLIASGTSSASTASTTTSPRPSGKVCHKKRSRTRRSTRRAH